MANPTALQDKLTAAFPKRNVYTLPRLTKVVVHIGVGHQDKSKDLNQTVVKILAAATGQKPVATIAKKSIANFKIRKGTISGFKTTLRQKRMYDFINKLINVALPRTRDFRGINPDSIDRHGNLTIGIKDMTIFPEVSRRELTLTIGAEITFHVKSKSRDEALVFFELLGIPFAPR